MTNRQFDCDRESHSTPKLACDKSPFENASNGAICIVCWTRLRNTRVFCLSSPCIGRDAGQAQPEDRANGPKKPRSGKLFAPRAGGTMNRTTEIHSQGLDNEGQNQKLTQKHRANGDGPRLVACVLLLPEDAEVLAGLLCNLTTNSHVSQDLDALANHRLLRPEPSDSWLPHVEAAKFLGVSMSTLYRYASQERIECRKIAGRLEYRQSILERLKQKQIRSARLPLRSGGIIPPALHSGK